MYIQPTDGLGGILSMDGMDLTSAYLLESLGYICILISSCAYVTQQCVCLHVH